MFVRLVLTLFFLIWSVPVRSEIKTLVVGFAPGGTSSVIARALAEELGAQTMVENIVGAGGFLAAQHVALGKDTTSLLLMSSSSLPRIPRELGLTPILQICEFDYVFVVGPRVRERTLPTYLEGLRAKSESLLYATTGFGSMAHAAGIMLSQATGLSHDPVPYPGSNPAIMDVVGGHVPFTIVPMPDFLPQSGGTVKALGVFSPVRSHFLPDVPTLREQKFNVVVHGWMGVFGRNNMPREEVSAAAQIISSAVSRIQERTWSLGFSRSVVVGSPFAARYYAEHKELLKLFATQK